ncbi:MAG TPA: AMP-binding protein [Terriglobales bacterium]|nr:AMP-binding protein [Terriglobales bacterium]
MTGIAGSPAHHLGDRLRPVLDTTIGGVLRDAAEHDAATVALVEGTPDPSRGRRWTFGELLAESERAARALLGRFAPGERVAICGPNSPEWLLVEFGAALAGIALVPLNPALGAPELAHLLNRSRAQGIVMAAGHRGSDPVDTLAHVRTRLPQLREVVSLADWADFAASGSATERLPEVRPDDPAQIHFTPRTAGPPKGAVLRHRGLTNSARFWMELMQAGPGDVWVNPMSLHAMAGCVLVTLGAVQGRFAHVLPPGFDPGLMLRLIESERGTMFGGTPRMLLAQLDHPDFRHRDLSFVRSALAGGAAVPPAVVRRVESALDAPLSMVFGRTEASPCVTQTRPDDSPTDRAETLGRPHPQVEVRIADPRTGETVPAGTAGEILTRGYHVMTGYADDPEATAAAIDAAGWLHTGVLGSMDERGYCRIDDPRGAER